MKIHINDMKINTFNLTFLWPYCADTYFLPPYEANCDIEIPHTSGSQKNGNDYHAWVQHGPCNLYALGLVFETCCLHALYTCVCVYHKLLLSLWWGSIQTNLQWVESAITQTAEHCTLARCTDEYWSFTQVVLWLTAAAQNFKREYHKTYVQSRRSIQKEGC